MGTCAQTFSRRSFVAGAAAAVAGTAATISPALAGVTDEGMTWDYETDVVVVGFGGAGASAAISACDNGAEVIILEKMENSGGNTAVSGGGFLCPDDVDRAYTYFRALYEYANAECDEELLRTFAEEASHNIEWIQSVCPGVDFISYGGAGFQQLEGAEVIEKYCVSLDDNTIRSYQDAFTLRSSALFAALATAVMDRGIQVLTSTPAQHLVRNANGDVCGVVAEHDGAPVCVRARRGVIMTCGGYEYDMVTKQNFLKGYPIYAVGNPGNTGDGIRMVQEVGAGLWHMNCAAGVLGFKPDDCDSAYLWATLLPGMIYVDQHGKRFINEQGIESHAHHLALDVFDPERLEYPRIPMHVVFDHRCSTMQLVINRDFLPHEWSADNSEEVEMGWIACADTIADLAEQIGVDPDNLCATVDAWNASFETGVDAEFGRPMGEISDEAYREKGSSTALSIEEGPFYAITLYPAVLNTQGGPRRNSQAQVLDAFKQPIPHLFAAGELGSIWGAIYQGAGNLAECMVYGRIAGASAAAQEPLA